MLPEPISQIIFDSLEAIIDLDQPDGFVKEIPLLGTLSNVAKSYTSIRDRIFFKKLSRFIERLSNISSQEKASFLSRIESDSKTRQKVGTQIVVYIDRLDDIDKSALLANVFIAFVREKISYAEFFDLCLTVTELKMHYLDEVILVLINNGPYMGRLLGVRYDTKVNALLKLLLLNQGLLTKKEKIELKDSRTQQLLGKQPLQAVPLVEWETTKLGLLFVEHVVNERYSVLVKGEWTTSENDG